MVIEYSNDAEKYVVYDIMDDSVIAQFKDEQKAVDYVKNESGLTLPVRNRSKNVNKSAKKSTEIEKNSQEIEEKTKSSDSETEISETSNDSESALPEEYEEVEWEDIAAEIEFKPETLKLSRENLRSAVAIKKEMKAAFDLLYETKKSATHMGTLVQEIYDQAAEDGYLDFSYAAELFKDQIQYNQNVGEDLRSEEEKKFYQAVTHADFKVDDTVKKEIVDYGDWQKKNKNLIMKASPNGKSSIDNFYSYLESEYPEVYHSYISGNAVTEGNQLVELVDAARKIQEKMYTREGDVGTAFEGLTVDEISHIWTNKLAEVLSKEKVVKKTTVKGKTKNEGKDQQSGKGKTIGSKKKNSVNGKDKSGTDEADRTGAPKRRTESEVRESERLEKDDKLNSLNNIYKKIINSISLLDKFPNVSNINGNEIFASVPEVLKYGIGIDYQQNWK